MINIRSKIRQRLLAYYFTHPKAKHFLRELAYILKVDPGNLSRELKKLEKEGLFISSSDKGKFYKYFFLNKNYPFYNEIKNIFLKSVTLKRWKFSYRRRLKKTLK